MSDLLVGKLLTVRPALAVKIGLNEAILLQQLDYWLNHADKEYEGRMWIYKSYEKWQEQDFPFWSVSTVKRIVKRLRDINLIDVESLSDNFNNRVNYYTINRNELKKLSLPSCQIDTMGLGQIDTAPLYQSDTTPSCQIDTMGLGQIDTAPLYQSDTTPSCQIDTISKEINKEINKESKHTQKIEGDVLAIRDQNAESIVNWQQPSKETMQAHLMMAGKKLDMTDNQYLSHVSDFKAYYEEQAANGKPVKRENLRQAKLKLWLINISDRQPRQTHDTANRPHNNRSDSFSQTSEPRLTREQQIEKNKLAMQQAGVVR